MPRGSAKIPEGQARRRAIMNALTKATTSGEVVTVRQLRIVTHRSLSTIHSHLKALQQSGRAAKDSRGHWRALNVQTPTERALSKARLVLEMFGDLPGNDHTSAAYDEVLNIIEILEGHR